MNFRQLPFIAEDLGYIDEPVKAAIKCLKIPGMRVLLFGFDGDQRNPHLPKNHIKNSVAYTGTHDTNTVKGWFTHEASSKEKTNLFKVIGKKIGEDQVSFELIKVAMASISDLSIIPLQDVLSLGEQARMNNPGNPLNNWKWRVIPKQIRSSRFEKLSEITAEYHR
jgi:4-alpha-glucanotransferase